MSHRIIVDVMGADNGSGVVIRGAVAAHAARGLLCCLSEIVRSSKTNWKLENEGAGHSD